MGYMATWGPKGFIVSTKKIAVMEGLSTSLSLKQDSENDTSGTQTTNTRGRELRPITFKVTYLAAAGVDPRGQIDEWEAQLGNAYPLIIGGKRFGAEKMKLTKVETSDILLSNSGGFIRAVISITLEEYSDGKVSKLISSGTSAKKAKSAKAKAAIEEQVAALNATASASDRASKKTSATTNTTYS